MYRVAIHTLVLDDFDCHGRSRDSDRTEANLPGWRAKKIQQCGIRAKRRNGSGRRIAQEIAIEFERSIEISDDRAKAPRTNHDVTCRCYVRCRRWRLSERHNASQYKHT